VCKGIALASFTQARCLDLGKGVEKNSHEARKYYKKVIVNA
jgi:TPR repeat protein